MSDSTSVSGITPRFTPRGARELIDDIDLLLDHLGRALPGRLEACFDDSRGNTARSPGAADPPSTPTDGAVVADGRERRRSKAAFVQHLVDIAHRAAPAPGEDGTRSPGRRDAEWHEFTTDVAFLIQARDFLATLARPATVDTVRLTRAFVDETVRRRGKPWRSRRGRPFAGAAGGGPPPPEAPGHVLAEGPGTPRNHAEIGVALAKRMHRYRWACFLAVILTLLLSLYALTGKTLLDEQEQTQAFLVRVAGDVAAAQVAEIQDARLSDARSPGTKPAETVAATRAAQIAAAAIGGRNYCDQPFLDDEGVVQYVSERQREICERLWGVNGYQNRLNQQLYVWSAPFAYSPLGWPFGITSLHAGLWGHADPALGGSTFTRAFTESARVAGYVDARALAAQRSKAVQDIESQFSAPRHRPLGRDAAQGDPVTGPEARPTDTPSLDYDPMDPTQIMQRAAIQAARLVDKARPVLLDINATTPLQGKAVLQGVGLYLMPCLYALLGAFVAVFRNISRKSEAALLDRADHDKAAQTLTLGVVFGAVIGLIADMLRANGTPPPAGGGTTITLGVSALALLAGYSVGHVFGLLDDISERVFGRVYGTADGEPR